MTASLVDTTTRFDVEAFREEFPILEITSRGKPLVYLDSAATSQKPRAVIDAVSAFYSSGNANIHRGVYQLSEQATLAWDHAREVAARFLNGSSDGIVFVRGTTEAINLVAHSFIQARYPVGARVLVTAMEHHANIVPWQLVGASLAVVPLRTDGSLDLEQAEQLLRTRPQLLAVAHVSNVLGTVNPIAELCRMARAHDVPVLVDGAQAAPHLAIDVAQLGCDFYSFSGHKSFGPTGIGVLWVRPELLQQMPPYQGGGDMIDTVRFDSTTWADAPRRFEAGTPDIAGAIGLGVALEWLMHQDRDAMHAHEQQLLDEATHQLSTIPGLRVFGTAAQKASVITFTIDGAHPHDIASLMDGEGVCIRAGHHCTQPLHHALGVSSTARASFAPYNTLAEVALLSEALQKARRVLVG